MEIPTVLHERKKHLDEQGEEEEQCLVGGGQDDALGETAQEDKSGGMQVEKVTGGGTNLTKSDE